MKIYFDESGQTGCVLLKKDMLNFANQPVFALGAVIAKDDDDERLLLEKYKKFKEKFKIVGAIYAFVNTGGSVTRRYGERGRRHGAWRPYS